MATKKIEFLSKSIGNFEDWAADASKSFISKNPTAGDAVNTVITGLKPFFYEAAHDSEFQALAMRTAHRNFMQAFYLFVDEYVCVEYKNALKVNVDYDLALKAMNFPKLFSMLKDLHTGIGVTEDRMFVLANAVVEFTTIKMLDTESIEKYCSRYNKLMTDAKSLGFTCGDAANNELFLIGHFIGTLQQLYKEYLMGQHHQRTLKKTFVEVQAAVLSFSMTNSIAGNVSNIKIYDSSTVLHLSKRENPVFQQQQNPELKPEIRKVKF